MHHHTWFSLCWASNLGLPACQASTAPAESHPWLRTLLIDYKRAHAHRCARCVFACGLSPFMASHFVPAVFKNHWMAFPKKETITISQLLHGEDAYKQINVKWTSKKQVWWYMLVILVLQRLKQENHWFKDNLGYKVRSCLKQNETKQITCHKGGGKS